MNLMHTTYTTYYGLCLRKICYPSILELFYTFIISFFSFVVNVWQTWLTSFETCSEANVPMRGFETNVVTKGYEVDVAVKGF